MQADIRKARNIERLKTEQVPYIEHLPRIEDETEVVVRSAEEILKRALTCFMTIQVAFDFEGDLKKSRKFFTKLLKKYKLQNELTANEKAFFTDPIERQAAINQAWKYEAILPLFWALGFHNTLEYPDTTCDVQEMIDLIQRYPDFKSFLKDAKIRDISEQLDEADLIYRYHWACVDARINGREMPAGLDEGVVMERHYGLNWLVGKEIYNDDWDEVDTST